MLSCAPSISSFGSQSAIGYAGLRQLQERLDGILARRKIVSGAVSAENKKQLMLIDRDLRYYEERIRRAVLIDPADQPKDEVHY